MNETTALAPNGLATTAFEIRNYLDLSKAANTIRAYRADWHHFESWCAGQGREALPASVETVAFYLTELARTHRVSTLTRRLSSLSETHQLAGCESPAGMAAIRMLMAGVRRSKGTAPHPKKPILIEDLRRMLEALPGTLAGMRDRALLLIGFAGAFRRSELVALDWENIEFANRGLVIALRRSKTDPEGQGRKIAIPYGRQAGMCPIRVLETWRDRTCIDNGPVFRPVDRHGNLGNKRLSDKAVARIVKRTLQRAGVNATGDYAGHSLRAGFATAAAAGGASERAIMNQTGHRSLAILRRYIREGLLFEDNAVRNTGL
jgi:site-specific recombinase XerD